MALFGKTTAALAAGLLLAASAQAQTARDLSDIGIALYQEANSPKALERMRKDLINAPEAYVVSVDQPGTLVLLTKRRVRVPAMKYNVALHLLEVRDSTGSHVWPPGSIDGFYMGRGVDARHFRTFGVRDSGLKQDFVEVLTAADDSPLVLAVQHVYVHDDAQVNPILRNETRAARTEIGQVVLAGREVPVRELRPLVLSQRNVLRLFGSLATEIALYATAQHLGYTDLAQVLRLVEYYNQRMTK